MQIVFFNIMLARIQQVQGFIINLSFSREKVRAKEGGKYMKKLTKRTTDSKSFGTVEVYRKCSCSCNCSCTHWFWNPSGRNRRNTKNMSSAMSSR